jgi:hypothetical protein
MQVHPAFYNITLLASQIKYDPAILHIVCKEI